LRRVHAQTVARTEYDFAGCSLKHVANDRTPDRMAMDNIWILPVDKSELTPRAEYRRSRRAP
jgi:translation initiation factor IF-1